MLKNDILKYYKSDKFLPKLPSDSLFRHYRGKTIKGSWRKCPRKIRTSQQLKDWIIKEKIIDCYYSTSKWLDPRGISDRNPKCLSEQILLGADLAFDIDENFSIKGLNKSLKNAGLIFDIASPKHRLEYICFTGMKGFRLVFSFPIELPIDPRKRVEYLEKKRKVYIDALPKDIKIDKDCLIDAYRIIRLLNSINGKTGLICKELPKTALSKNIQEVLNTIRTVNGEKATVPRILAKQGKEMTGTLKKDLPRVTSLGSDRDGTGSSPYIFITNQDGKRFVPFFKYRKDIGCRRELKRLHKIYDIGPIWLFEDEDYIWAFGIRTFQRRRLQKVYNASRSILSKQFSKYGRQYFRVIPELKLSGKMDFKTNSFCSQAHYKYLISRGIEEAGKLKFHKNAILKLTKVKWKE